MADANSMVTTTNSAARLWTGAGNAGQGTQVGWMPLGGQQVRYLPPVWTRRLGEASSHATASAGCAARIYADQIVIAQTN